MKSSWFRRCAALLLLCVTCSLCFIGGKQLFSSLYLRQADLFLSEWAQAGSVPGYDEWDQAHLAATRACALSAVVNGGCHDRLGRIYEWKLHSGLVIGLEKQSVRREMLRHYILAAEARPTWGYSWANLAVAKWRAGMTSVDIVDDAERAFKYAPWEFEVLEKLAFVGFAYWKDDPRMEVLTRDVVVNAFQIKGRAYPRFWLAAKAAGLTTEYCEILEIEEKDCQ